jgi:hypothetical protein
MTPAPSSLAQRLGFKLINIEESPVLSLPHDLSSGESVDVATILACGFKALLRGQITDLKMSFRTSPCKLIRAEISSAIKDTGLGR